MQLDDDFFASLNQQLTSGQKQNMAENVYSELEDRVGNQMAARLSDEQYEEFNKVIEQGGDHEVTRWLEANDPGHEQLVDEIFETIKHEAQADPAKFL